MISLTSSSRVKPTASFAATRAMGKPVAFEARAEERLTRGFISITTMRPVAGSTANWTLDPPVSTPISRMAARAAFRIRWYSRSVRVRAGATVIESPVCTPIGSMFSIEQMMMALSARSRTTSSSNSFQPSRDSSISTWPLGEASRPPRTTRSNSAASCAMPPPVPPRVKAGRMMAGRPTSRSAWRASSMPVAMPERGLSRPIRSIAARNSARSSAVAMALRSAPMSCTPCRARMPESASAMVTLRALCPPMVGSSASGRSASITRSTMPGSTGSI